MKRPSKSTTATHRIQKDVIVLQPTQGNLKATLADMQTNDSGGSAGATPEEHPGCSVAWGLLKRLWEATAMLESNMSIPEAVEGDELAAFSRAGAAAVYSDVDNDEIWETVNPELDCLLGFARPRAEIKAILRRGLHGVMGLQGFIEYLVEEKGVIGALLEGKLNILLEVMAE